MFAKRWIKVLFVAALVLTPLQVLALTADIYGYTKAEDVKGSMQVSNDAVTLVLNKFTTIYFHPLEIYISKGYDLFETTMVGVLEPGFEGARTFTLQGRKITDQDMILFMVPGWTVPVAVGLFRDEATVFFKPPGNQ